MSPVGLLLVRLAALSVVVAWSAPMIHAAEVAATWRAVKRVHGVIAIENHTWIRESLTKYDRRATAHIEFTLAVDRSHGTPAMIWRAESARVIGSIRRTGSAIPFGSSTQSVDFRGRPARMNAFYLTLDPRTGAWEILSPDSLREKYEVVTEFFGDDPSVTRETQDTIESVLFNGTVTGQAGPTHGTFEDKGRMDRKPTRGYAKTARIFFWPEFDDVEVEVTIDGYEEWRPRGSIAQPGEVGNSLVARATLKSKEGKTPDLPEVDRFRFELIDTSQEPGVCMNWPLGAKDEDYDLRLAAPAAGALPSASFGDVSADGQTFELPSPPHDAEGRPHADAMIECMDFGAKSELRVTCVLRDGREIIGVMKGEDGEQELVRLPRRAGPDWVADAWRKEKDVQDLAANDDNETVAGQNHNGDGFTLYEEYRGWVVNGRHLEGDPKRKDFFVRNRIGADAKGGIALFERVSKLRVHSRLRASEIIELPTIETEAVADAKGERIMNLNHRDAPHRVDQHAVILINTSGFRSSGGGTEGVHNDDDTNRAFRPGKVQFVRIEERGRIDGVFSLGSSTAAYNLSAQEAAFAYDRGVAHELLHAVGVDHHGEGEELDELYFQSASDPNNPTRRARFVARRPRITEDDARRGDVGRGDTYTLIWEDTQRDVAEELAAEFERALAVQRAQQAVEPAGADVGEWAARYPQAGKDAFYWRESELHDRTVLDNRASFVIRVTSCQPGGADSGHELCLMRYYFANAYPIEGRARTFYLVRPGPNANHAGRDLCHSPDGTGHNAPSHQPQSRFGHASPGRGNCFQYICPNDAIPGRTL